MTSLGTASMQDDETFHLIHCPPRSKTALKMGVDETIERTNSMTQKQRLLGMTRQSTN